MKREPLKIGERVRVFSHYGPYDGEVTAVDCRGNTPRGFVDGLIRVKNSEGQEWYQHPRQCVRLRRRERSEKRERITAWARQYDDGSLILVERKPSLGSFMTGTAHRDARLVECAEGEVVLSRAELAKAWDKVSLPLWKTPSVHFDKFANLLGLGAE